MSKQLNSPPAIQRHHSVSRSVSMKDWHQRQLTIEDVEELMDLDETKDSVVHHKLQTRLDTYNGPNPFVHVLPFTFYEKLKIFLFAITGILIAKVLIFIIIVLFCYIGCIIKNCCCKTKNSVIFNLYLRGWVRIAMFVIFGLYWIPVKYKNGKKFKKWPKIITPNHVSILDAFMLYYVTGAVFVAKKELQSIPAIGGMMSAIGVVWVDRSSKKARKDVINRIRRHALNDANLPLAIFAQGTCSNTMTITQFKPGAFIPGVLTLPTAIHYTNCFCDMALLGGLILGSIHTCSQFINFATIEFLEPYQPSQEEKNDAILYASNVRKLVADALNAEVTPHTFDDLLLAAFAYDLGKKGETAGVNMIEMAPFIMDDCYRKLQMKTKTVIALGKIYMKHCDEIGRITLETFCNVFRIKDQVLAKILFELIMGERDNNTEIININIIENIEEEENKQEIEEEEELKGDDYNNNNNNNNNDGIIKDKYIMFDDFLVGVAVCYQDNHIEDALILFYSMMDREYNGYVIPSDCINFVKLIEKDADKQFNNDINQFCLKIFDIQEIENSDKKLNFEQFKESVIFNKQTNIIQEFLQFIIFSFLDIKLDENMIVVTK